MDNPAWSNEERFSNNFNRWQNQDELDKLIEEWTINHTAREVMEILQKAGVSAGPSLSPNQLFSDPQLRDRAFFIEMDHHKAAKEQFARMPWICSTIPNMTSQPPPGPGEHNSYVFGKLLGNEHVCLID